MEREEQRNSSDVSYILHSDLFNIGRVPESLILKVGKEDINRSHSESSNKLQ